MFMSAKTSCAKTALHQNGSAPKRPAPKRSRQNGRAKTAAPKRPAPASSNYMFCTIYVVQLNDVGVSRWPCIALINRNYYHRSTDISEQIFMINLEG